MTSNEDMIEELTRFGLTRQEATIYLTLLTQGQLSGYEVAKLTGISRSNTYSALAGLVDKGAACYEIEGNTTKYTPVELKEYTGNVIKNLTKRQKKILEHPIQLKEKSDGYITITGYEHVTDKIHNMIVSAKNRIYFAAPAEVVESYHVELEMLHQKKIKIVILTSRPTQIEGATVYQMEHMKDQIRLIVDSSDVLTGKLASESDSDSECNCLYSCNYNLVDVFKEMMRSEIVLLEQKYGVDDTVLVAMPKEI